MAISLHDKIYGSSSLENTSRITLLVHNFAGIKFRDFGERAFRRVFFSATPTRKYEKRAINFAI